jgi:predicted ATPase/class 3 adenylate cyclase
VHDASEVATILFKDIEGSTGLWDQSPERMRLALARHDALVRSVVERNRGTLIKFTGDGVYAMFPDSVDALATALEIQLELADPKATGGVALRVRCGLHAGEIERRDNDYFGSAVNRGARIMGAAHGGQVILSQAVVDGIAGRLPDSIDLRDLGSVRLRDLSRPEHVYQALHPRLRQEFPALRSLEAAPNNLPQQTNSFVGREEVLAAVKKLFATTRSLTLLGAGGLGKTRLSLQLAAELIDDYPDGAWFVELAPLSDPRLVAQAVASVLGVVEEAGRPVEEALVRHVKDRRLLLVLDNCEHLVQPCAELAKALLRAGPEVKVLATSRESLRLPGETIFSVPPLVLPPRARPISSATLTEYESVRLFRDRAVAAQPGFEVTEKNAPAIAEICHTLDGIPLALELAAARVRALSVEAIATRLSDRFRLLTSGDRTSPRRQQTLRACIDWSFNLLSTAEQAMLRRLAVFSGGWTLEAAERVGTDAVVDAGEILDLLSHLVDKSLVQVEADDGRYRLLETVRQYAEEQLAAAQERDETRSRHLAFFVDFAEEASPHLMGSDQGAWLERLDTERENILFALQWCDRAEGGGELGLRLLCAVRVYWFTRGLGLLGMRVMAEALGRPGAQERTLLRCKALDAAAWLGYFTGRYGDAQRYEEEGLSIAREIEDRDRVVAALTLLGAVSLANQDRHAARRHLEECLALARELGDILRLEQALTGLAELYRVEGDLDRAEPLYAESLVLNRREGVGSNIAVNLLNLAMVAIGRGSIAQARTALMEAFQIAEAIRSRSAGRNALDVAAGLAAVMEDWARASRIYGAAQFELEQTGVRREAADEAFLLPLMATARTALGEDYTPTEAAGRALAYEEAVAETRSWLEAALSSLSPASAADTRYPRVAAGHG